MRKIQNNARGEVKDVKICIKLRKHNTNHAKQRLKSNINKILANRGPRRCRNKMP